MSSLNSIMKERLGFLFDCQMDNPFWFLLCGARSVKHLEKLHNSLPSNCQLLRDDFIKLRKFFQELPSLMGENAPQSEDTSSGTQEEKDKSTLELFRLVSRGNNPKHYMKNDLTDYYWHRLHGNRDCFHFRSEAKAKLIGNPCIVSGLRSFNVNIFDANFETYCCWSETMKQLGVNLGIWSDELTEPLTFQLLSLPKSTSDHYTTGYQGNELILAYALPGEWVPEYLCGVEKIFEETLVDIKSDQLESFCEQLKQLLIESEIPAQAITPNIAKQ